MTEGPYKLPEGWRWVRLGEVCSKPEYGYTASATTEPVGPKFLRITDITSGAIDWDNVPYCVADEKHLAKYRLAVGDILFARSGSIGATIVIKDPPPEAVFASYLIRVRLKGEILPDYAEWVLKAPVCQGQLTPQGAAQKNINAKHIQELLIPLPPLEEQRRIVARIEALMARVREARRLREQAREEAERLWQSVLADTFPRPGSPLTPGWRWVRLEEVCEAINGVWGTQDAEGDPVIRSTNFTDEGYLSFDNVARVLLTENQRAKARLLENDILLERSGGGPNKPVGRVCIFTGGPEQRPYYFGNFITVLRINEPDVDAKFVFHFLRWFHISGGTEKLQTQTTNIRNLRFREYLETLVPLPPLAEQRRIVAHLEAVQEKIRALRVAQAQTDEELKRLEQTILDKAFRGEL